MNVTIAFYFKHNDTLVCTREDFPNWTMPLPRRGDIVMPTETEDVTVYQVGSGRSWEIEFPDDIFLLDFVVAKVIFIPTDGYIQIYCHLKDGE